MANHKKNKRNHLRYESRQWSFFGTEESDLNVLCNLLKVKKKAEDFPFYFEKTKVKSRSTGKIQPTYPLPLKSKKIDNFPEPAFDSLEFYKRILKDAGEVELLRLLGERAGSPSHPRTTIHVRKESRDTQRKDELDFSAGLQSTQRREQSLLLHDDPEVRRTAENFAKWLTELADTPGADLNTGTIFSLFSCVFRLRPPVSEELRILHPSEVPVQLKGGGIEFVVPKNWQIAPDVWMSMKKTDKEPFCASVNLNSKQVKMPQRNSDRFKPRTGLVGEGREGIQGDSPGQEEGAKRNTTLKEDILSGLHGCREFLEYIKKNKKRVPRFLQYLDNSEDSGLLPGD
ncbi:FAM47 [Sparganum proliferum]